MLPTSATQVTVKFLMLSVDQLSVRYGTITAVREVSFTCAPGETIAIVGPNGAGKSSILNAISGAVRSGLTGEIRLGANQLITMSPERVVKAGVALVPEGRRVLASLTVSENLQLAMSIRRDRAEGAARPLRTARALSGVGEVGPTPRGPSQAASNSS